LAIENGFVQLAENAFERDFCASGSGPLLLRPADFWRDENRQDHFTIEWRPPMRPSLNGRKRDF
jgi:hypothetical protein